MIFDLVFEEWRDEMGQKQVCGLKSIELSSGCFHSGSTFKATVELDDEDCLDLTHFLDEGYVPVFLLRKEQPTHDQTEDYN